MPEPLNQRLASSARRHKCVDAHPRVGVQVVYLGGIDRDLDEIFYQAAGRGSNDEGCTTQGEGRRDMFWRCDSEDEAVHLACRLLGMPAAERQDITVVIKSEEEHFAEKPSCPDAAL